MLAALVLAMVTTVMATTDTEAAAEDGSQACPRESLPDTALRDTSGIHGDGIRCLLWYGVAEGRTPTSFGAADPVQRGQMATLLTRVLQEAGAELPRPQEPPFDDAVGTTHEDAIERLAAAGVYTGDADGDAAPRDPVSREQFAAFVVRAIEWLEDDELPAGDHGFSDVDGVHERVVAAAADAGLVRGRDDGTFEPTATLRREQGATILAGLLERFVGDDRLELPPEPTFRWDAGPVPASVREAMTGTTWDSSCPVGLDQLRLVELNHRDFEGRLQRGELIVNASVVDDLEQVFATIFDEDFPLEAVEPAYRYDGDDDAIMAANTSHAFNCRQITGGDSFSEHSYGTAIDLNPIQNPYERGGTILPPEGEPYLDRSNVRAGMLLEGEPVVEEFDALGWTWGARWNTLVDYMHFEYPR